MAGPIERAATIIKTNKYLSLATIDSGGPWSTPINYVVGLSNDLIFYSARESRHAQAIGLEALVSISIFDSRAESDEVDGLQSTAQCVELAGDTLSSAHEHYFRTNYDDPATRDWWFRPVSAFTSSGVSAFYSIRLSQAYVIDYDSVTTERIDRRLTVEPESIWSAIGDAR